MSFLGFPSSQAERRSNESRRLQMLGPKKEYKWGYCFVPANGEFETGNYLNRVDTRDFIIFKKFLSKWLGDNFEAKKNLYPAEDQIRILTDIELDVLYIKMVSNFNLVKKINFKDELAACIERQRIINEYDEEHIAQTIRKMKRMVKRRKPFGAKTPQLNKLDILKTERKIIPYK